MMDETVVVRVHIASELLPEDKIPEIEDGESVIVSKDVDKPFTMIATMGDLAVALRSLQHIREEVDDVE